MEKDSRANSYFPDIRFGIYGVDMVSEMGAHAVSDAIYNTQFMLIRLQQIENEYKHAIQKFGNFNSPHEGYAVIKEELDELWDEIKKNGTTEDMANEVIQVGAMALRFLIDCC